MEDNTSAKFEFLASFILPESILDWFDFIKSREDEVLNYFINHSTNAGAEYLNSKTIINAADEIVSTLESYEE